MMSSISSGVGFQPPPPPKANTDSQLTSDQQSIIEETLAQYDADNLTEQDAMDIVDAFAQSDIEPSAQFAKILSESGFDAREIGDMAKGSESGNAGGRPPGPGPDQQSSEMSLGSIVDFLDSLSADESTASSTSIAAELASKFGLTEGQSLINVTA